MRLKIIILIAIVLNTTNLFGQNNFEKIELPEILVNDSNLIIVLDSLLESEKLCDYYNDSLYFEISICNNNCNLDEDCHIEDTMLVVIYAITNKSSLFRNKHKGFFTFKNHLYIVRGILMAELFIRSDVNKIFEYKKEKRTTPSIGDDRKSIWGYYFINGEFVFESGYPKCPR